MNRRPVVHMSRVTPFYNVISAFFQTHGACRQCDQILRIFATLAIFGRFIQYLTKLWACYGKLFMLLVKYSLLQRAKNQKNNVFVWSHFGCRDRLAIKTKTFFYCSGRGWPDFNNGFRRFKFTNESDGRKFRGQKQQHRKCGTQSNKVMDLSVRH